MVFNMRYLDERVWVILRELRPLIERQHIDITKWQTKKKLFMRQKRQIRIQCHGKRLTAAPTDGMARMCTIGSAPSLLFHSRWMENAFLKIHTQIEEWDDGRNPQFLFVQ